VGVSVGGRVIIAGGVGELQERLESTPKTARQVMIRKAAGTVGEVILKCSAMNLQSLLRLP
jgi:hypothetical protein